MCGSLDIRRSLLHSQSAPNKLCDSTEGDTVPADTGKVCLICRKGRIEENVLLLGAEHKAALLQLVREEKRSKILPECRGAISKLKKKLTKFSPEAELLDEVLLKFS